MDPLSISTSILAIISTASVLAKTIRTLDGAPSGLVEVAQAVNTLERTVDDVRRWHSAGNDLNEGLGFHIQRSEQTLLELKRYLDEHGLCSPSKWRSSLAFLRHQDKLRAYRQQLSEVRNDLSLAVSAANYGQTGRIEMDVQQLVLSKNKTLRALSEQLSRIDNLARESGEIRKAQVQMAQILETIHGQGGISEKQEGVANKMSSVVRLRHSIQMETKLQGPSPRAPPPINSLKRTNQVLPQVAQCSSACRCCCHKKRRLCTPQFTRDWVGELSITFSEIGPLSSSCTVPSCVRNLQPAASVTVTLPGWLASHVLSIWLKAAPLEGPQLLLRSRRIIETPAYYTAEQGNVSALRKLYAEGRAGIHDVNPLSGRNALFDGVFRGHLEVVKFLLDGGADMEAADFCGFTPRDLAFQRANTACPAQLAEQLQMVFRLEEVPDDLELTSLHRIVLGISRLDLHSYLQEHPEHVNTADLLGRTPLWWAVRRDDGEKSLTLVDHGADPSLANAAGRSPLHNAAAQGSLALVEALLAHGASVDPKSFEGKTPLQVVGVYGVQEDVLIVRRLVAAGADLNVRDGYGRTPISLCCFNSHVDIARVLLDAGADLQISDGKGWFPWHWAIFDGAERVLVLYLTHKDCDLGTVTEGGETILHFLVDKCLKEKIVDILLATADLSNVDVNARNALGNTAEEALEERHLTDEPALESKGFMYWKMRELLARVAAGGNQPALSPVLSVASSADSWHTANASGRDLE